MDRDWMERNILETDEVAEYLKMKTQDIYDLVSKKKIKPIKAGRGIFFKPDIEEYKIKIEKKEKEKLKRLKDLNHEELKLLINMEEILESIDMKPYKLSTLNIWKKQLSMLIKLYEYKLKIKDLENISVDEFKKLLINNDLESQQILSKHYLTFEEAKNNLAKYLNIKSRTINDKFKHLNIDEYSFFRETTKFIFNKRNYLKNNLSNTLILGKKNISYLFVREINAYGNTSTICTVQFIEELIDFIVKEPELIIQKWDKFSPKII